MIIEINVNPVAFSIGPVNIAWYGIMVALAVVVLILWTVWAVKRGARLTMDDVLTAALVGIPSGVVFARLLHVIDYWDYYLRHPAQIIGGEGLSIYGAVLGAALGLWVYSRVKKTSFAYLADVLAPGIILSQAVGRVGCTLNGCCYGKISSTFLAIVYTNPYSHGPIGLPVHPTQVYEIIYNLAAFFVLFKLRGRLRPDGSLFLVYLSLYSFWRLMIDFIRDGQPFLFFPLHQAQVIALAILAVTVPLLALRTRWVKPAGAEKEPADPA